jgi:isopenicillin N synthase-like dioxygenase
MPLKPCIHHNPQNEWPPESAVPHFKSTFKSFFQICHELHVDVMKSIAVGLGLEESFFDKQIDEQYHNLRLLNYPSIRTELLQGEGQARAGAHSDYGTLTFVFQDNVGGLQVQNPHTKQYHPATPIVSDGPSFMLVMIDIIILLDTQSGTIVVNIGGMIHFSSNLNPDSI